MGKGVVLTTRDWVKKNSKKIPLTSSHPLQSWCSPKIFLTVFVSRFVLWYSQNLNAKMYFWKRKRKKKFAVYFFLFTCWSTQQGASCLKEKKNGAGLKWLDAAAVILITIKNALGWGWRWGLFWLKLQQKSTVLSGHLLSLFHKILSVLRVFPWTSRPTGGAGRVQDIVEAGRRF